MKQDSNWLSFFERLLLVLLRKVFMSKSKYTGYFNRLVWLVLLVFSRCRFALQKRISQSSKQSDKEGAKQQEAGSRRRKNQCHNLWHCCGNMHLQQWSRRRRHPRVQPVQSVCCPRAASCMLQAMSCQCCPAACFYWSACDFFLLCCSGKSL